jgi:hypothetical protein
MSLWSQPQAIEGTFVSSFRAPRDRIRQTTPDGPDGWEPPEHCSARGNPGRKRKEESCPTVNRANEQENDLSKAHGLGCPNEP